MHKLLSIGCVLALAGVAAADPSQPIGAADIRAGIQPVLAQVRACGARARVTGVVKVSATIAPDGTISSTTVKATPDPVLGTCVARAVGAATFRPTESGASFSYPFRF